MSRTFFTLALAGFLTILSGSVVHAGRLEGPGVLNRAAAARQTVTSFVFFEGGKPAIVSVTGDGDTDLDLYIFDENGSMVAADLGSSDRCVVSWTPKWTSQYTIKVVNRGNVLNNFKLRTN